MLCLGMVGFVLLRTGLNYLTMMQYEWASQNMLYNVRTKLYGFKSKAKSISTTAAPASR